MAARAKVLVGTSGFSYDDWVGPFYPAGTPREEFLGIYAREFPVVELNYTWYSQPRAASLDRMQAAAPGGFLFAVKAHRSITHDIAGSWEQDIEVFREGVRPLQDSGRLAAVLAQFPWSFAYTPETRTRLARLCDRMQGLPLVVEFRRADWLRDTVYDGLRARGVALASVDEPELPGLPRPVAEATAAPGYVRFHGRNAQNWWTGDNASRYDYLYSREELAGWIERIRAIMEKVPVLLLFFNNHWRGNAAQNAREMRMLLADAGLT